MMPRAFVYASEAGRAASTSAPAEVLPQVLRSLFISIVVTEEEAWAAHIFASTGPPPVAPAGLAGAFECAANPRWFGRHEFEFFASPRRRRPGEPGSDLWVLEGNRLWGRRVLTLRRNPPAGAGWWDAVPEPLRSMLSRCLRPDAGGDGFTRAIAENLADDPAPALIGCDRMSDEDDPCAVPLRDQILCWVEDGEFLCEVEV